jgi:hypothetical protein
LLILTAVVLSGAVFSSRHPSAPAQPAADAPQQTPR